MTSDESSDDEKMTSTKRKRGGQRPIKKPKPAPKSKKLTRKKPTKDEVSDSDSDMDDKKPLSALSTSKKEVKTNSSDDDDDDLPLGNLVQHNPTNGKKNDKTHDDDQSDSDKDAEEKPSSDTDSDNDRKASKKSKPDQPEEEKSTGPDQEDASKKPKSNEDDGSSDTSVYNSDPGSKSTKEKQKKLKRTKENKEKEPKQQGVRKNKSTTGAEEEDPRLTKLKKCVRVAGLRCVYKQLFDGCASDKERIKKLEEFFRDKGLSGSITMEACKEFRHQREEQKELAELDMGNIISEGRCTRSKAPTLPKSNQIASKAKRVSSSDESEDSDEGAKVDSKELFSRLKGIVDSGESDSD